MQNTVRERRLAELDALRGVAAAVVLVHHFLQIHGDPPGLAGLSIKPFFDGQAAVVVFFVLSGFALTRQLQSGSPTYRGYVARRFLRIYPTVWASLILGLVWVAVSPHLGIDLSVASKLEAGLVLSSFNKSALVHDATLISAGTGVLWSLVVEIRASLLMPLMSPLSRDKNRVLWCTAIVLVSLLAAGTYVAHNDGLVGSALFSARYLGAFFSGALIANFDLSKIRLTIGAAKASLLLLLGVVSFGMAQRYHASGPIFSCAALETLFYLLGGALLVFSLSLGVFPRLGSDRLARFLGEISYSLYLSHPICLTFFLIWPVEGAASWSLLLGVSAISAIAVAWAITWAVDRPSIRASRWAGKTLDSKPSTQ